MDEPDSDAAPFPPRLHVLLARDATTGVVLRRGPSKQIATIGWDRRTDEFRLGQWLKGRIYERRSDLSPNGQRMIYFAMNGHWQSETGGSWTAISRAPYLKALALFGKGDCWNGGGLWLTDRKYWLNDGYGHSVLRETSEAQRDPHYQPSERGNSECLGVYFPRLIRDGWRKIKESPSLDVFEKPLPGGIVLRKLAHATSSLHSPPGQGCYWDTHELRDAEGKLLAACPDWEWAELDRRRLVWASGGMLHAGTPTAKGVADERVLCDFRDWKFEAVAAPY